MAQTTESVPFQLKNIYTPDLLADYAAVLQVAYPNFDPERFLKAVFNEAWPALELKARTRHISHAMRQGLPAQFDPALSCVVRSAELLMDRHGEQMLFQYGFIADFVEHYGADHPALSIPAITTITRFTSAEFAIRPLLLRYPDLMYPQMLRWAEHPSFLVRRLASEGFRPRLPWGMGIPALKRDPSPVLPVLEKLKSDPAETVRRSVANNLNDIAKDHPELALELARRWLGQSAETDWVVKHGCRSLLKRGNEAALGLFGFDQKRVNTLVQQLQCQSTVPIGGRLAFSFSLFNPANHSEAIRLEYAIDYLTLSGKVSTKVFKIKEFQLAGGESLQLSKFQRFQDFTTRKHFTGTHGLRILVNGLPKAECHFEVINGSG